MKNKKVLAKVFRKIGSRNKLAILLGISRQAVSKWIQVPIRHVLNVENLTGISRTELRPDVYRID